MRRTTTLLAICLLLLLASLSACRPTVLPSPPADSPQPSATQLPATARFTPSPLPSATLTLTPTVTASPSLTRTPTLSLTPSISPSPTFDLPDVQVIMQAHCRYGASIAYLHAADLYPGDRGVVWGRFAYSQWLQIKFDKLAYPCWAAPSVIEVSGDISLIYYTQPDLLSIGSNSYGPPQEVVARRDGDLVTIHWKRVGMTVDDDRGYFIEAFVCQQGVYKWWTAALPDQYSTSYSVQDEPGCHQDSGGEIRTVEKHGYSEPATIPWP